jgi:uncharacterized membrane protein
VRAEWQLIRKKESAIDIASSYIFVFAEVNSIENIRNIVIRLIMYFAMLLCLLNFIEELACDVYRVYAAQKHRVRILK